MAVEPACFENKQSSGYDLEFINEPPDALKCPICLFLCRDPLQHGKCGRIYCKSCLSLHSKSSSCPYCREENPQYFEDSRSKRDILTLRIYCSNKQYGCLWEGETREIDNHSELCDYRVISCPRKCCTKILHTDLKVHLEEECVNKDYECPFCGEWGIYCEITTSHLESCPNGPTTCPNEGCHEQLPYQKLSHHVLKACDYAILECRYKSLGCTATFLRKDMADHEGDDKYHLHVALATLAELRERSASMEMIMYSVHRQYLPRTDAKKLRSDIKQGIEKIHVKCENLQHEVVEFNGRCENLQHQMKGFSDKNIENVTEMKLIDEKLEKLKEGLQNVNQEYLDMKLECRKEHGQLANKIKQHQEKISKLQYLQKIERHDEVVLALTNIQDQINWRFNKLSNNLKLHHDLHHLERMVLVTLCYPCIKCGCCLGVIMTVAVITILWYFLL